MQRVYYEADASPESRAKAQALYSEGEAGFVWVCDEGYVETDTQVSIPANSLHALHGHGVVEALNDLPQSLGPAGGQRDAVIEPSGVHEALRILYAADRMTYGGTHDLLVALQASTEYRIVIDNREYQRTLSRLQFLFSRAMRIGCGVRIRV
jgi:hypothetical protein